MCFLLCLLLHPSLISFIIRACHVLRGLLLQLVSSIYYFTSSAYIHSNYPHTVTPAEPTLYTFAGAKQVVICTGQQNDKTCSPWVQQTLEITESGVNLVQHWRRNVMNFSSADLGPSPTDTLTNTDLSGTEFITCQSC